MLFCYYCYFDVVLAVAVVDRSQGPYSRYLFSDIKKKKESTSTVRMIIKLKEEDETGFLFSFRFNQFPLNGTLFQLKPARYHAFWETLFIILMRSQNRYLYPTEDKLAMSCTIAVYDHLT